MKYFIKYTKVKTEVLLLIIGTFISCEPFIDVELPSHLLTQEAIYENPETTRAALSNIYSKLRDNTIITGSQAGISNLLSLAADEMTYYGTQPLPDQDFYNNAILPGNPVVLSFWNQGYNLIYAANDIIEGVTNSSGLTPQEKEAFIGEALFIRAFIHHYLTLLYGKIPYITTTDYLENTNVTRQSIETVYENIISDLQAARDLLPDANVELKTRPDRWVATAMLARVFLYQERWPEALEEATVILNNFQWEEDINDVFLNTNPGTIWQLMPESEAVNTLEAQTFIFTTSPPPLRALNQSLVDSFESNDLRKTAWIGEVSNGTESWFHPYKYKLLPGSGSNNEYSIVFRLAELYLIRAEAHAHLNNIAQGVSDLNKTRNRAGLDIAIANDSESLLVEIFNERKRELFTEMGHRWFDLIRSNMANTVLGQLKPGWNNTDVLLPLPEQELLLNPNLLPQNPGY